MGCSRGGGCRLTAVNCLNARHTPRPCGTPIHCRRCCCECDCDCNCDCDYDCNEESSHGASVEHHKKLMPNRYYTCKHFSAMSTVPKPILSLISPPFPSPTYLLMSRFFRRSCDSASTQSTISLPLHD